MATVPFTRWFQSQVFTPGFRLPDAGDGAPPWSAPDPAQRVLVDFIRLRHRFTPYIAAIAARRDPAADEVSLPPATLKGHLRAGSRLKAFAFGPSLRVWPVPADQTLDLPVVLPRGATWLDFWSGASYAGDQCVRPPVPLDMIPLFARAGSIIPLSFLVPPAGEASDSLEVRVYPGADGRIELPDTRLAGGDEGGPASIRLSWDDRARVLRFGACRGRKAAGRSPRRFHIVIVRPGHGVGHLPPPRPDQSVIYDGAALAISFPPPVPCPRAPVGLTAKITAGHVLFSWRESSEGVVYRLKRKPVLDSPCEDIASSLSVPFCKIPLSEHVGSRFGYVVTAMNAGGESAPSAAFAFPCKRAVAPLAHPGWDWRPRDPSLVVSDARLDAAARLPRVPSRDAREWSRVTGPGLAAAS